LGIYSTPKRTTQPWKDENHQPISIARAQHITANIFNEVVAMMVVVGEVQGFMSHLSVLGRKKSFSSLTV
jgi:hypothetical protein